MGEPANVRVERSARRRRTVSAYRDGDVTVVQIPARMSKAQEAQWVATMVARLDARRTRGPRTDQALAARARRLAAAHLPGCPQPTSVRWSTTMRHRWGSCTPVDGTIRLSDRLADMPPWVLDYVLIHELAHLLVAGHDERFWALVGRYPKAERARGYLEGVAAAAHLELDPDQDGGVSEEEGTLF